MPLIITSIEIHLLLQIKSFMIEVTQLGKMQMFLKTTSNSYSIIKHQEIRFFFCWTSKSFKSQKKHIKISKLYR